MSTEFVSTDIDDRGVATVTLDNPDKHNAFDDTIISQLTAAFSASRRRQSAISARRRPS